MVGPRTPCVVPHGWAHSPVFAPWGPCVEFRSTEAQLTSCLGPCTGGSTANRRYTLWGMPATSTVLKAQYRPSIGAFESIIIQFCNANCSFP